MKIDKILMPSIVIVVFIMWALLAFIFRSCMCSKEQILQKALQPSTNISLDNINLRKTEQSDTSLVPVSLPLVTLAKSQNSVQYVYIENDSTLRKQLLYKVDSLQRLLYSSKTWALDTIHSTTFDTLRIECEEMQRSISLYLKPAPRTVERITNTITNEVTVHSLRTFGIGIHAGVGVNTETKILPVLSFGFNYILF